MGGDIDFLRPIQPGMKWKKNATHNFWPNSSISLNEPPGFIQWTFQLHKCVFTGLYFWFSLKFDVKTCNFQFRMQHFLSNWRLKVADSTRVQLWTRVILQWKKKKRRRTLYDNLILKRSKSASIILNKLGRKSFGSPRITASQIIFFSLSIINSWSDACQNLWIRHKRMCHQRLIYFWRW